MNELAVEKRSDVDLPLTRLEAPAPPKHHWPTAKEMRVDEVNTALRAAYEKAGTLVLNEKEREQLIAPFDLTDVAKRPHDGFSYIPHILISDRLTRVFGPGQWTMIRRWDSIEGNTIYAEWIMIVRGIFIGESVGAAEYFANNKKQNFSDVLESTRGEAIRRIAAKYLSCGSQVWNPSHGKEKPAGPMQATEKTRIWFISQIQDIKPQAFQYAIDNGLIMPNDPLESWPLKLVPVTTAELAEMRKRILQ